MSRDPTQNELFDDQPLPAVAPFSQPTTSREAAEAIEPVTARLELEVLDALRRSDDGLCNHEIEALLDMPGNTVRPRVWTLRKRGLVEDSGRVRLTPAGRRAIVWSASPHRHTLAEGCACRTALDIPDPKCPLHGPGGAPWPPRCPGCGQPRYDLFLNAPKPVQPAGFWCRGK